MKDFSCTGHLMQTRSPKAVERFLQDQFWSNFILFHFHFLFSSKFSLILLALLSVPQTKPLSLFDLTSFHSFCTITWSSWIMGIKQSDWLRSLLISSVCKIPGDPLRIGHQSKWLTQVNFTFLPLILTEKRIQAKSFSLDTTAFTFYILQIIPNHCPLLSFDMLFVYSLNMLYLWILSYFLYNLQRTGSLELVVRSRPRGGGLLPRHHPSWRHASDLLFISINLHMKGKHHIFLYQYKDMNIL